MNIQCMVFGNMGDTSGTGVLFTRNPSTGEKKLYGEFLVNAHVWTTYINYDQLFLKSETHELQNVMDRERMWLQG